MTFIYSRRIHFYETDAMGIVHHAAYLNLLEESRVDLLRQSGILGKTGLEVINYPVLHLEMDYKKSLYFDDEVQMIVTPRAEGVKLIFSYEFRTKRFSEPCAFGKTVHIAMEMKSHKPIRLPEDVLALVSKG